MIVGEIANRRAHIRFTLMLESGASSEMVAVIDTGFTGFLTIPSGDVTVLGLQYLRPLRAVLADGSRKALRYMRAQSTGTARRGTSILSQLGMNLL